MPGLSSILSEYGTSLEEMRKLSKKFQAVTGVEQILSPEQARDYGFNLSEGYKLKLTPGAGGFKQTVITPEGWSMTDFQPDESGAVTARSFISPEGQTFSYDELQKYYDEMQSPIVTTAETPQFDLKSLLKKTLPTFDPDMVMDVLSHQGERPPERGELTEDYELNQSYYKREAEKIWNEILTQGRTKDTETLLRVLGADDAQIEEIFSAVQPQATKWSWTKAPEGAGFPKTPYTYNPDMFTPQAGGYDFAVNMDGKDTTLTLKTDGTVWSGDTKVATLDPKTGEFAPVDTKLWQQLLGGALKGLEWLNKPMELAGRAFYEMDDTKLQTAFQKEVIDPLDEGLRQFAIEHGYNPYEPAPKEWKSAEDKFGKELSDKLNKSFNDKYGGGEDVWSSESVKARYEELPWWQQLLYELPADIMAAVLANPLYTKLGTLAKFGKLPTKIAAKAIRIPLAFYEFGSEVGAFSFNFSREAAEEAIERIGKLSQVLPAGITDEMTGILTKLGYTKKDILLLKPDEAMKILKKAQPALETALSNAKGDVVKGIVDLSEEITGGAKKIEMAPSTSVQTGLEGMGKETAHVKMFEEVSGKESGKVPITKVPEKIAKLEGQTELDQLYTQKMKLEQQISDVTKKTTGGTALDREKMAEVRAAKAMKPKGQVFEQTAEGKQLIKRFDLEQELAHVDEQIAKAELPPTKPPEVPPVAQLASEPPSGSATKAVYDAISFDPKGEGLKDKILRGLDKAKTDWLDKLYPIDKYVAEAKKTGVKLSMEEDPYIMARLLEGLNGKASVFLDYGTFGRKLERTAKGTIKFKSEGLTQILESVKAPVKWRDFSTYLTSLHSVELSDKGIKTGIARDIADQAIKELELANPEFSRIAAKVGKYQSDLLDYIEDSGLISKELRGKLDSKYWAYVPFYRVMDDLTAKGFLGKKMANVGSQIKRIKGSERTIVNPLESIVKNTYTMISAADHNQVGILMARLAEEVPDIAPAFTKIDTPIARVAQITVKELGIELPGVADDVLDGVFNIFRPSMHTGENVVTVLIEGKKQFFKVDPDIYKALMVTNTTDWGVAGRMLSYPSKWLRAGATLSPDFMVRNPLRDQFSAFVYSRYGYIPGVDFISGLASVLRKDDVYQAFKASGAEHSMLVSMDRQYLQQTFKQVVEGNKFTDYIKHPLELLQIVSELGEKATRVGEFKKGLAKGATLTEAGMAAREVTLDFAKAGTQAKAVNQIVAFFNSNIRGWDKMITSFKEAPMRTSAKVLTTLTIPSVLLYLVNRDDPRYKEIPQWQKDSFWIILVPGSDTIYRIPKPFELGMIFGSGPERFLEYLDTKDPKILTELAGNILEAGIPGLLPTAVEPIIENWTNYSFFKGAPIVPGGRENMPPELQYTRWSSDTARKMGELLDYPPAKIDNIIQGWTGGLGKYATNVLDYILKGTGISTAITEPTPDAADIPVLKAFVVRSPIGSSSESVNKFYDALEQYTEGEQYLKEMLRNGEQEKFDKFKSEHPELLFFYDFDVDDSYSASARYLRRVAGQLSDISKAETEVYNSKTMSGDQKQEKINELEQLKTDLARKAMDLFAGTAPEKIITEQLADFEKNLGLPIDYPTPLSNDPPEIYDMKYLAGKFRTVLEGAGGETVKDEPFAVSYLKMREADEQRDSYFNDKLYRLNADSSEGDTYIDWYLQWQSGDTELYPDAYKGNLTRRQYAMLEEYNALYDDKEKKQYLIDHPELTQNPREEYLKSHPEENAHLAIWGQAKILTKEAYNIALQLIKELDIPDIAVAEFLPPKEFADDYFKYNELVNQFSPNAAEVQLLKANNPELTEWLGLEIPDTPVKVLELKVKNNTLDPKSPEYDDNLARITAYQNGADDEMVEKWVERGQLTDKFSPNSAEAKLWLYDNPDIWRWALDNELLTDDGSDWNIPVLRLNMQFRADDEAYDAMNSKQREVYLKQNPEYAKARLQKDAYQMGLDETMVGKYVEYKSLPTTGDWQERYLVNNPDFTKAIGKEIPSKVMPEEYDVLNEKENKTPQEELKLKAYQNNIPEQYIEDYVDYYMLPAAGYSQERYLKEHPDFYKTIKSALGWKTDIDFDKIPSAKVENLIKIYDQLPTSGKQREAYRKAHPDLDEWLINTRGLKPLGQVKKKTTETSFIESFAERELYAERFKALFR